MTTRALSDKECVMLNSEMLRDKLKQTIHSTVGASHGILPHVGNTNDQVTLTQIGIQVTAG
jgi:hypothetical protein